jgi:hypothetical protein
MPAEVRAQPIGTRLLGTYADEIWATMFHGNRKTSPQSDYKKRLAYVLERFFFFEYHSESFEHVP